MIKVTHSIFNKTADGKTKEPFFLLTNKLGGFFLEDDSKYRGLNINDSGSLFKSVESIKIEKSLKEIKNNFGSFEKVYDKTREVISIYKRSLMYEVKQYIGFTNVTFDFRHIYDFSEQGRIYNIYEENGFLIVEYKKFSDDSLSSLQYIKYLVIKHETKYNRPDKWRRQEYEYDLKRGSGISSVYVFDALSFKINNNEKIVFTFSDDKEDAKKEADYVFKNWKTIEAENKNYVESVLKNNINIDTKTELAYLSALKSFDDLIIDFEKREGIYAGLPWFFHYWARDELISLKALILSKDYHVAKKILMKYVKNIPDDGRLFAIYPESGLKSADATGWLFKRLYDYIQILTQRNSLYTKLKKEDLEFIRDKLLSCIESTEKNYIEDGLVYNNVLETWMDTSYCDNNREGFNIEIQALFLNMYKTLYMLSGLLGEKKSKLAEIKIKEEALRERVKQAFFMDGNLKDNLGNAYIRPNVFIAYYVYPELLSRDEWTQVFKKTIDALWLEWGGFSSINKDSGVYFENYTGENNHSYHHGDSWFFINNMAAICLNKTDSKLFSKEIQKIVAAGINEILFSGYIGNHAEISSASELKSEGCRDQSWSAALFIELIDEVYLKNIKPVEVKPEVKTNIEANKINSEVKIDIKVKTDNKPKKNAKK
jgi:glycogen debranching enzyme